MAGRLREEAWSMRHCAAFGVLSPIDQARHSGVTDGPSAHRTRLQRHIKRGPRGHPIIAQRRGGEAQHTDLGVGCGVVGSNRGIGRHRQNGPIRPHKDRAHGGLACGGGCGRQGLIHKGGVARGVIHRYAGPLMNTDSELGDGDRIAKILARAGVCSRRDAERLIAEGRVKVNGAVLTTPAFKPAPGDDIRVDNRRIAAIEPPRLWRYHKPAGLVTTHRDPNGRPTVFEKLPTGLPRVVSVGRLDLNSEGLLLLTNDGGLARHLELPSTGLLRRYRARAYGRILQEQLDSLRDGLEHDGVQYGPIVATLERQQGGNAWIELALTEGKNREVRKVLDALGLKVNRLIRITYGPFELGDLRPGQADEVPPRILKNLVKRERKPRRKT